MSSEPRNLLTPFRRDLKSDFASGTGEDLERSKVTQVLATEGATPRTSGELPWRTNFGSALHLLRHQRNDEALAELARVYCRDALTKWLRSSVLFTVATTGTESDLTINVKTTRSTNYAEAGQSVTIKPSSDAA